MQATFTYGGNADDAHRAVAAQHLEEAGALGRLRRREEDTP